MITSENLPTLVSVLVWPLLVLALFLVFQKEIRSLIQRIEKAKLPGGSEVVMYGDSKIDKTSLQKQDTGADNNDGTKYVRKSLTTKWQNSGDLFWLAHDLTWTIDVSLRGGSQEKIILGLAQAELHAKAMELPEILTQKIFGLKTEVETLPEEYFLAKQRKLFADKIYEIISLIGRLAERNQPGYKNIN